MGKLRKMKFSIIVLIYNSSLEAVLMTIKSLIMQKFSEYEIIIADDGSEVSWKKEIVEFFSKNNFHEYFFAESDVNVGTVKNILRALKLARGKYVKCIGAGDVLFDSNVLNYVYDSMNSKNAYWAFGKMEGYCIRKNEICKKFFIAPLDLKPYKKNNKLAIKEKIVVLQDHISGASMFFERDYLEKYLLLIEKSVKYVEDLLQVLIMLDDGEVLYLPKKLIAYEMGVGISTLQRKNPLIVHDFEQFNKYLLEHYKDELIDRRMNRNRLNQESGFWEKHIYLLINSPKHVFLEKYRDMRFWPTCNSLGFLDQKSFYEEFGLKR